MAGQHQSIVPPSSKGLAFFSSWWLGWLCCCMIGGYGLHAQASSKAIPDWDNPDDVLIDYSHQLIQQRIYGGLFEAFLHGSAFPSSPYYRGWGGGLGLTLHLSPSFAWQIVHGLGSWNVQTSLQRQFKNIATESGRALPSTPEIVAMAASHLVVKPFYGKQALLDVGLIHLELYAGLGPGVFLVQDNKKNTLAFGGNGMVGTKVWFQQYLSLKAQLSQAVYYYAKAFQPALHVDVGLAIEFGAGDMP